MITIYAVKKHPGSPTSYIGQTTRPLTERLRCAYKEALAHRENSPYAQWLREWAPNAHIEALEEVATPQDARIAEAWWIKKLDPPLNVNRYKYVNVDIEAAYAAI